MMPLLLIHLILLVGSKFQASLFCVLANEFGL